MAYHASLWDPCMKNPSGLLWSRLALHWRRVWRAEYHWARPFLTNIRGVMGIQRDSDTTTKIP